MLSQESELTVQHNGMKIGDPNSDPTVQRKILIDRMMEYVDGYENHLNEWEQGFVNDMTLRCSKDDYNWTVNQIGKLREICGKVARIKGEV